MTHVQRGITTTNITLHVCPADTTATTVKIIHVNVIQLMITEFPTIKESLDVYLWTAITKRMCLLLRHVHSTALLVLIIQSVQAAIILLNIEN